MLEKPDGEMEVNFIYKSSEKKSGLNDRNIVKINALMLLQIPVVDLESTLEQLQDQKYRTFVSDISSWNVKLEEDANDMFVKAHDNSFIQAKINSNYYKALSVSSELQIIIPAINTKPIHELLKKVLVNLDIVIEDLEKHVGSGKQPKKFQYLTVNFIANICLFEPCLENINVTLSPMLVDTSLTGFCQDSNKGPYDMWQVEGVFTQTVRPGKFFTFSKEDKIYLCLSEDGIHKGRFYGELSLFGSIIKGEFRLNEKQIVLPRRNMSLYGKYSFIVHNKISFQLGNWNMLNIDSVGETSPFFNTIVKIQNSIDNYTKEIYNTLKARVEKSKLAILEINSEKIKYENEIKRHQKIIQNTTALLAAVKRNYGNAHKNFKIAANQYEKHRSHMISIDNALKSNCQLKSCPYDCVNIPRCQICQDPYIINKTVLSCKVSQEDVSYGKIKEVNGMCSRLVKERSFRYIGNCKRLPRERVYYNNVINRIKKKISVKQPLTLEDAYLLEIINMEKGKEIREHILETEFTKSLKYKLENGLLMEEDFATAEKYKKNRTFVNQLRKFAQNIKNANTLKAIATKINASEPLTNLDYQKLRVCVFYFLFKDCSKNRKKAAFFAQSIGLFMKVPHV